jgi:hypothetical protein
MEPEQKAKLEEKRKQINAKLRALRGKEKGAARKEDNHRKMLAGAFLLEQAKRDPAIQEWMMRGFAWFLTRPDDRTLFNIGPTLVTDKANASEPSRPIELPSAMGQVGGNGQSAN